MLLPWATLVGLSRVLKGRHFPLDILFGALIGAGLGIHLESHGARREDPNEPLAWYQDDYSESQWAKAVGGILLAVEWGFYYGIPLLARKLAPWILVVLNFLDESWAASHHREARGKRRRQDPFPTHPSTSIIYPQPASQPASHNCPLFKNTTTPPVL